MKSNFYSSSSKSRPTIFTGGAIITPVDVESKFYLVFYFIIIFFFTNRPFCHYALSTLLSSLL